MILKTAASLRNHITAFARSPISTKRLAIGSAVIAYVLCADISLDLCGGALRGALLAGVIVAVVDVVISKFADAWPRVRVLRLVMAVAVVALLVQDSRLTASEVFRTVFAVDSVPDGVNDVHFRRMMPKAMDDLIFLDFVTDQTTLHSLLAVRGFVEDESYWAQWKDGERFRKDNQRTYLDSGLRCQLEPRDPWRALPGPPFARLFSFEPNNNPNITVIWVPATRQALVKYCNG